MARHLLFAVMLILSVIPAMSHAASSRYSWLVDQLYTFNHPFKAQLPGELSAKMEKMAVNPFAFYRGTAHLFYQDMNTWPTSAYVNYATALTWLEGDMHLQNLGAFRDANGNEVFDTTDFDEGYWGQYVWDVRRMTVSILLAAKENGLSSSDQQKAARRFLESYLTKLADFKGNDDEKTYRLTTGNTNGVVKDTIQALSGNSQSELLSKYTTVNSSGKRLFAYSSSLQAVSATTLSAIKSAMTAYINSIPSTKRYGGSYYTIKDVALKTGSGVGSLGRYRYYLLLEGSSTSSSNDVILEMKQEVASAVSIAAPDNMPASVYGYHEGNRVVKTHKAMLNNADVLLGYTTMNGLKFMLREKSAYQEDFDYSQLTSYSKFYDAAGYFGKVVAKNHALADKDYDSALIGYSIDKEILDAIGANSSGFITEILNFSVNYAAQVEQDYTDFLLARQSGEVLY